MFEGINAWAILVSVLASAVIGMLWYSKALFLKPWMEECGLKAEDLDPKKSAPKYFGALVAHAVGILCLALIMKAFMFETALQGLLAGLAVSIAFMASTRATNYLYEGRSLVLFLIDSGYNLIVYGIAGIILGAWR